MCQLIFISESFLNATAQITLSCGNWQCVGGSKWRKTELFLLRYKLPILKHFSFATILYRYFYINKIWCLGLTDTVCKNVHIVSILHVMTYCLQTDKSGSCCPDSYLLSVNNISMFLHPSPAINHCNVSMMFYLSLICIIHFMYIIHLVRDVLVYPGCHMSEKSN